MKEGPASLWPPGVVTTTGAIWLPVIDPVRGGVITTICVSLIEVTCPATPLKVTEAVDGHGRAAVPRPRVGGETGAAVVRDLRPVVKLLVVGRRFGGADGGGHGDVELLDSKEGRRDGRDLAVGVDREALGRRTAEEHLGGSGEVAPGELHRRPACGRPEQGADGGDARSHIREGDAAARAAWSGHGDRHGPGDRKSTR